jgi:hypothetical protein
MAVVVAIIAVVITFIQGQTQKQLQITSWKPVLVMELIKSDADSTKGFLLKNVGFGPAEVVSFRYYKDSNAFEQQEWNEQWLDTNGFFFLGKDMDSIHWDMINFLNPGYLLSSQPGDNTLFLLGTKTPIYNRNASKTLGQAIVEIKYISISKLDKDTNYLRFCEIFQKNNIRDRKEKHVFEKSIK